MRRHEFYAPEDPPKIVMAERLEAIAADQELAKEQLEQIADDQERAADALERIADALEGRE